MTAPPRSATDALELALGRFGADRLLHGSALVRNALRDLVPGRPLTASLLALSVDHGVAGALVDQSQHVALPILGPRLAARLSAEAGLGAPQARWAVAAWAKALGLSEAAIPPWPPAGDENPDLGAVFATPAGGRDTTLVPVGAEWGTATAAATRSTVTVASPPTGTAAAAAEPVSPTVDAAALESVEVDPADLPTIATPPAEVRRAPDVPPATVLDPRPEALAEPVAATVAVPHLVTAPTELLGRVTAGATDAAAEPPAPPTLPTSRRRRGRVLPAVLAAAVVVAAAVVLTTLLGSGGTTATAAAAAAKGSVAGSGGAARSLGSAPVAVAAGRTVAATRGPVELHEGASVARLGDATRVRVVADRHLRLLGGRLYVDAAHGAPVIVDTPDGTTTVSDGRLLVRCDGTCRFQALDERQTVPRDGHAVLLAARAALAATGTTPVVTAADLLRADPWIAVNLALDKKEGRASAAIAGPSILGRWTIVVHRADLPLPFSRPLDVAADCRSGSCVFTVGTNQHDDRSPGRLTGTAQPADSSGTRFTITYPAYAARCAYPGEADGTERLVDTITVAGSGAARTISGERTTVYTPRPGSRCASAADTRAIRSPFTARPAKSAAARFPAQADQQQLLFNYVEKAPGGCAAATDAPVAGLQTDVVCSYPTAADADGVSRPAHVELAVYGSTGEVKAAYAAALAASPASGAGACATGPCESTTAGGTGRLQLSGTPGSVRLVAYDPRKAHLLVIATGGTSFAAVSSWWTEQETQAHGDQDIASAPIPRVGL